MSVRVLIVDDSTFYRKRLKEMFASDPAITVVGEAANGREAVNLNSTLKPDVITMDVEMPVMGGIEAVREIMKTRPTAILMFSSMTEEGAQSTLDAMDAGASDFMPKDFSGIAHKRAEVIQNLIDKVKELGESKIALNGFERPFKKPAKSNSNSFVAGFSPASRGILDANKILNHLVEAKKTLKSPFTFVLSSSNTGNKNLDRTSRSIRENYSKVEAPISKKSTAITGKSEFSLVVIGSSTGGPQALNTVITALPSDLPFPILVVQHMPVAFTPVFAERLNRLSEIDVKEAASGDVLKAGNVYVAPGGKQMILNSRAGVSGTIQIVDGSDDVYYRPCIDITLKSVLEVSRSKVLVIIMTGMGQDGRKGCELLKQKGAEIWAQDEASSVIYGMPRAVSGIASKILSVSEIANAISETVVR